MYMYFISIISVAVSYLLSNFKFRNIIKICMQILIKSSVTSITSVYVQYMWQLFVIKKMPFQ